MSVCLSSVSVSMCAGVCSIATERSRTNYNTPNSRYWMWTYIITHISERIIYYKYKRHTLTNRQIYFVYEKIPSSRWVTIKKLLHLIIISPCKWALSCYCYFVRTYTTYYIQNIHTVRTLALGIRAMCSCVCVYLCVRIRTHTLRHFNC